MNTNHDVPTVGNNRRSRLHRPGRTALQIGAVAAILTITLITARFIFIPSGKPFAPGNAPERTAQLVDTTAARLEEHTVTIQSWGEVKPSRTLNLHARVSGRVKAVNAEFGEGELMSADDTLVQLDKTRYALAVKDARSALSRARADLQLEKGQQNIARVDYEKLDEDGLSETERALILRKPQLASAQADIQSAETDLTEARLDLDHTAVTAPFDALILSQDAVEGMQVNSNSELAELAGVERWWLELTIPAEALRWIESPNGQQKGASVRLRNDNIWPKGVYREGHVIRVLGELEPDSRLPRVLVGIDDPLGIHENDVISQRLLLGSYLKAEIKGRSIDNAVVLDPDWIHDNETVWLMNDANKLTIRHVTIAYRSSAHVIVSNGISPGEKIITTRISMPSEGMPLRALPSSQAENDVNDR